MVEVRPPQRIAMVDIASPAGCEAWLALSHWEEGELVLAIDHQMVGKSMRELCGPRALDIVIEPKLGAALDRVKSDVMVDFGNHAAAAQHALSALKRGVVPIVGAGLNNAELRELKAACVDSGLPCLVAPNFSIGAVLMFRLARIAARYMPQAEIVEVVSDARVGDLGSAKRLAEVVAVSIEQAKPPLGMRREGDRTVTAADIPMHQVKNRGLAPQLSCIFGSNTEALVLQHTSHGGAAWTEGLKVAIREIRGKQGLFESFDHLLFGSVSDVPRT